jgi:hypothetical protein
MKKWLHIKFGWFDCRFHPFDIYNEIITCRLCGKKYKTSGYPYVDQRLTSINSPF